MDIEVKDLRSGERFALVEPLTGSFGSIQVHVRNIAEQGVQIEHAEPLRIATRGRFSFRRRDLSVSTQALVVWSRLSRMPNDEGKYLYQSGIRIEEEIDAFASALKSLAVGGLLRRDPESLERKKQRIADRVSERAQRPIMKIMHSSEVDVPADQALLVQHARERLRSNPEEALKWYNRAKFATDEDGNPIDSTEMRHREDVVAVWEYLERSVPLAVIIRVFERT